MAKKLDPTSKEALKKAIARNLKNARTMSEPKMTQAHVAKLFSPKLSRAAIAQWEVGDTLPDVDRLAVLSKAFGVTIDSLVFGDDYLKRVELQDFTPDAIKVARSYMSLSKRQKEIFLALIQTINSGTT